MADSEGTVLQGKSKLVRGRIVRGDAKVYHVDFDGEVRQCAPRGRLFDELDNDVKTLAAVGDWVWVEETGDPPGIEKIEPRRNSLSRTASSHDPREQVLFSNVDQLFVIGSVSKPGFSSNRTDRILAACRYEEIPASLVLNKIDLDKKDEIALVRDTYEAAGIRVIETCATDGRGVDELAEALRGKVSALYGASGAGKSTLINAIEPTLKLRTAKISKYWDAGKHTTTYSQMHRIEAVDGWIIDTPGIRVFRLHRINSAELRDLFPEFEAYASKCQFPDCSHAHEPDCAVFDALDRGDLAPTRYASYLEILDEVDPPPPDNTPELPPDVPG